MSLKCPKCKQKHFFFYTLTPLIPSPLGNSISFNGTPIWNMGLWISCCVSPSVVSTLCYPTDCHLPGSSVHGILQARIREWVSVSHSSQPRDWTWVSRTADILYHLSHQGTPLVRIIEALKQTYWIKSLAMCFFNANLFYLIKLGSLMYVSS